MSDCCSQPPTPQRANPAGLPELRYRIGTWSSFRDRMVGQLGRQPHSPQVDPATAARPLSALTTRAADDPTIALVDACACVCDVLTFYQERILNEGYLGTATETRSVTEIARSIGYRPDPGVAATTSLAFTIDPQVDDDVVVPLGQPVLSVPGPQELPQTFETTEELLARHEWNELRPSRTVEHPIGAGTDMLYLAGIATGLRVGDPVVVLGAERSADPGEDVTERWDLRFVTEVVTFTERDTYAATNHTRVTLDRGLGDEHTLPAASEQRVITFGNRASLFGWNAPDARMMSAEIKDDRSLIRNGQWRDFDLADDSTRQQIGSAVVDLDREYPGIVADSWVCLVGPTEVELYRVQRANPASRTEFSLTARATRLFLDSDEHLDSFRRRSVTVLCESRQLPVAGRPADDAVSGFSVTLDGAHAPLPVGRRVVVSGVHAQTGAPVVVETTVADWQADPGGEVLHLTADLPPMRRDSVRVLGNVAPASHGAKAVGEVLGRGDATAANQRLELRRAPLTWLPGAAGATNTLVVRVAGVAWAQVETFFGLGPNDRAYTVGTVVADDPSPGASAPDAPTVVTFGDGRRGARLPTGVDNVVADYRSGIGASGNVAAGRLTLLQERPAAVRQVVNPLAAHGGADPAPASEIRRLAPLDVLTLGRLVSLADYGDHAGTFPGVGRARAASLWDGHRSFVHLTVAEASGAPLPDSSDLRTALLDSLQALKDPAHRVVVHGHLPATFRVHLRLRAEEASTYGDVSAAVVAALGEAFAFDQRDFGQPVTAAEVVAVAHRVVGLKAVDLERLHRSDAPEDLHEVLPAARASWDGVAVSRAELLLIDPQGIVIAPLEDT